MIIISVRTSFYICYYNYNNNKDKFWTIIILITAHGFTMGLDTVYGLGVGSPGHFTAIPEDASGGTTLALTMPIGNAFVTWDLSRTLFSKGSQDSIANEQKGSELRRFVSQDGNGTQAARRHVLPLFVQHGDKDESTTAMSLIATGSYGGGVGIWLDAGSSAPWRFLGSADIGTKLGFQSVSKEYTNKIPVSGLTWLSTTFTIDEKEIQEGKCTAIMYLAATAMTVSRDKDSLPQKSGLYIFKICISWTNGQSDVNEIPFDFNMEMVHKEDGYFYLIDSANNTTNNVCLNEKERIGNLRSDSETKFVTISSVDAEHKQFGTVTLWSFMPQTKRKLNIVRKISIPNRSIIATSMNSSGNRIALSVVPKRELLRVVLVLDMNTLDCLWRFTPPGSGPMRSLLWVDDSSILCPSDDGKFSLVSCIEEDSRHDKHDVMVLDVVSVQDRNSNVVLHNISAPSGVSQYVGLLQAQDKGDKFPVLCIGTENGLHIARWDDPRASDSKSREALKFSFFGVHDVACCGIASRSCGTKAVVGDLGGNVVVWDLPCDVVSAKEVGITEKSLGLSVVSRVNVGDSVRCVTWCPTENEIVVGTLCGSVFVLSGSDLNKDMVSQADGSVTCMAWSAQDTECSEESPIWLAYCTTNGEIVLLDWKGKLEEVTRWDATPNEDQEVNKPVWSISFNATGKLLAAACENKKTYLWSCAGTLLRVLEGHTMAVTCVAWRDSDHALVTCSDDRTIRIYDMDKEVKGDSSKSSGDDTAPTWSQGLTLKTIWNHLMITYLAINPQGTLVAVATMGGNLYIFSLTDTELPLVERRVHYGSIEGLQWAGNNLITTCSSDCTVGLFRYC
eukprot:m.111683 g.111683  ORF g.111683 m.111683 type:complete len:844 (+) comp14067_c0_seq2:48-2579(+)